jgi:hypothetical protein
MVPKFGTTVEPATSLSRRGFLSTRPNRDLHTGPVPNSVQNEAV